MGRRLCSSFLGIYGAFLPVNDVVVDAVLDVRAAVGNAEDALRVGLVLREQQRARPRRNKESASPAWDRLP